MRPEAPTFDSRNHRRIPPYTPAGSGGGGSLDGTGVANNYARWTDADSLEARTPAQVLADIGAAASAHNHDSDYAAISHNHNASAINAGSLGDARVAESNVTQHQSALSITESQISDLGSYALDSHNHSGVYAPLSHSHSEYAQIYHFQVEDDGTTGQTTTSTSTDLAGMWAAAAAAQTGFSWNGTTGELTVTAASSVVEFDINIHTHQTAANRHELHVRLLEQPDGGSYSTIKEASSYTSRNGTQDEGQTIINGFKIFNVAANTKYKVQVFDIGVAGVVGAANVAGQSYISAKRYV